MMLQLLSDIRSIVDKFTSISRIMHRLLVHIKWQSCFVVKLQNSLLWRVAAQWPRPQSSWLLIAFEEWCRNES